MLFFENVISIQQLIKVECDGLLISFSFKLFILAIGTWAVFYRYAVIILGRGSRDSRWFLNRKNPNGTRDPLPRPPPEWQKS